jgi:hypothetical protein
MDVVKVITTPPSTKQEPVCRPKIKKQEATFPLPVKKETDIKMKVARFRVQQEKLRYEEKQKIREAERQLKLNRTQDKVEWTAYEKELWKKGTALDKPLHSTPKSTASCQPAISKPTCHPSSISETAKPPFAEIMSRIQNQTEHLEYQIWEAGLQTRNPV